MNVYITFAVIIVGWCAIVGAITLLMRQWERQEAESEERPVVFTELEMCRLTELRRRVRMKEVQR